LLHKKNQWNLALQNCSSDNISAQTLAVVMVCVTHKLEVHIHLAAFVCLCGKARIVLMLSVPMIVRILVIVTTQMVTASATLV
jgi:hypothetical protein